MFYDKTLDDLKKEPYYSLLTDIDIVILTSYVNDSIYYSKDGTAVDFGNNEQKEMYFNIANSIKDKFPIDKSLIFLTTKIESFKWNGLDSLGIGQLDIGEYADKTNEIKNKISYLKYIPILILGAILFKIVSRKGAK